MTFFAFLKTLIIVVLGIVIISAILIFQYFAPDKDTKKKKEQEKLDRIMKETEAIAQIEDPFKRGQKYEKLGMVNKAFESYQKAALQNPEDITIQVKYLDWCIKENKVELILHQYLMVLNLTPEDTEKRFKFIKRLMAASRLEEAEDNCQMLLELKPTEKRFIQLTIELYIRLKNYEEVDVLCEKLLELDKYNIELRHEVGEIYQSVGNMEKALQNFKYAYEKVHSNIKYRDSYEEALYEYTKDLYQQEKYEEVVENTNQLLGFNKDNFEYILLAGKAFNKLGDYNSALVKLRLAKVMRPEDTEVIISFAEVLFNKNKSVEALKILKKATLDKPEDYKIRYAYGVFSGEAGKIQVAIKELEESIKLKENFDEAHYNLAVAYETVGETEKAIEKYKFTLMINPNHLEAKSNLENLDPSLKQSEEEPSEEEVSEEHQSDEPDKLEQSALEEGDESVPSNNFEQIGQTNLINSNNSQPINVDVERQKMINNSTFF